MNTDTVDQKIHEMMEEVTRVAEGYHARYGGAILEKMDLDVIDEGPIPGTSAVVIHYHILDTGCRQIVALFVREDMADDTYASEITTELSLLVTQPVRAAILETLFPDECEETSTSD